MPGIQDVPEFRAGDEQISAGALNAMLAAIQRLDASTARRGGESLQMLVQAQEAIAANSVGTVKRAYWDGAAIATIGPEFEALNIGPSSIADTKLAFCSSGVGATPFFQYTVEGGGGGGSPTTTTGLRIGDIKPAIETNSAANDHVINGHRWLNLCYPATGAVRTVGDVASGGTAWASNSAAALFAWIWDRIGNAYCPVSGGRGVSAAADFAAHKTIELPDARKRYLLGIGGSSLDEIVLGQDEEGGGAVDVNARASISHGHGDTGADGIHSHDTGTLQVGDAGGHSHGLTGASAGPDATVGVASGDDVDVATDTHVHDLGAPFGTGSAASVGDHFHGLSGATGDGGTEHAHAINAKTNWPPHLAVCWFILAEIVDP